MREKKFHTLTFWVKIEILFQLCNFLQVFLISVFLLQYEIYIDKIIQILGDNDNISSDSSITIAQYVSLRLGILIRQQVIIANMPIDNGNSFPMSRVSSI